MTFFHAVAAPSTTLTDALVQAYQTNPQIRQGLSSIQAANESVTQLISASRPTVTASGSLMVERDFGRRQGRVEDGYRLGLSVSQILFDGGQGENTIDSARTSAISGRQALVMAEQSILLDAVSAYMDVLRDEQLATLAESNVAGHMEQVRAANERFQVGLVTRTDVSLAEARLAAAQAELEMQQGALLGSMEIYRTVVGSEPVDLEQPPPPPAVPATVEEAEAIAMRRHPRILEARLAIEAAEFASQRYRSNRSPVLSATVSHTLSRLPGSQQNTSSKFAAALNANVTLFDGGMSGSERRQATALLDQRRFELQHAASMTRQSIRIAYSNWRVTTASISAIEQQTASAQLALEGVREEVNLGARTILDALDAEQETRNAQANLLSARRNEYVAVYRILAEMGLLTVSHLNLGIAEHNPTANWE